jgi:hypothetical protein
VPAVEAVDEGTEGALALALAEFRNGHLQAIMVMLEQKHQCDVLAGTVDEIEANCRALAEEHLTGIIHLSELLPPRPGAALRERAESSQNRFRAMANDALRMAQSRRDRAQTLYAEVPHDLGQLNQKLLQGQLEIKQAIEMVKTLQERKNLSTAFGRNPGSRPSRRGRPRLGHRTC